MSEIEVLSGFKRNLISFLDDLIDQFPEEPDIVVARIFIADQIPIKEAMEEFVLKLVADDNKLKKMIKKRDEEFFLANNPFEAISENKFNHFARIWRSDALDEENKDVMWRWVDSFVYFGDKYMKLNKV